MRFISLEDQNKNTVDKNEERGSPIRYPEIYPETQLIDFFIAMKYPIERLPPSQKGATGIQMCTSYFYISQPNQRVNI